MEPVKMRGSEPFYLIPPVDQIITDFSSQVIWLNLLHERCWLGPKHHPPPTLFSRSVHLVTKVLSCPDLTSVMLPLLKYQRSLSSAVFAPSSVYGDEFSSNCGFGKNEYSRFFTHLASWLQVAMWASCTSLTSVSLNCHSVATMKSMSLVRSKSPIASDPVK